MFSRGCKPLPWSARRGGRLLVVQAACAHCAERTDHELRSRRIVDEHRFVRAYLVCRRCMRTRLIRRAAAPSSMRSAA